MKWHNIFPLLHWIMWWVIESVNWVINCMHNDHAVKSCHMLKLILLAGRTKAKTFTSTTSTSAPPTTGGAHGLDVSRTSSMMSSSDVSSTSAAAKAKRLSAADHQEMRQELFASSNNRVGIPLVFHLYILYWKFPYISWSIVPKLVTLYSDSQSFHWIFNVWLL